MSEAPNPVAVIINESAEGADDADTSPKTASSDADSLQVAVRGDLPDSYEKDPPFTMVTQVPLNEQTVVVNGQQVVIVLPESHKGVVTGMGGEYQVGKSSEKNAYPYRICKTQNGLEGLLVTTKNSCRAHAASAGCERRQGPCKFFHIEPGSIASNLPERKPVSLGIAHSRYFTDQHIAKLLTWSAADKAAIKASNAQHLKEMRAVLSQRREEKAAAQATTNEMRALEAELAAVSEQGLSTATNSVPTNVTVEEVPVLEPEEQTLPSVAPTVVKTEIPVESSADARVRMRAEIKAQLQAEMQADLRAQMKAQIQAEMKAEAEKTRRETKAPAEEAPCKSADRAEAKKPSRKARKRKRKRDAGDSASDRDRDRDRERDRDRDRDRSRDRDRRH